MGPKAKVVKFYSGVSDRSEVVHLIARLFNADGGPGSGNWGHRGRPGLVGGSGKGSGGASFRSGSKEKGYSSFKRNEAFRGILEHAKSQPNKQKFLNNMPAEMQDVLERQYEDVAKASGGKLDETGFVDYVYRMYDMLNTDKPKRDEGDWEKNLTEEEKDSLDSLLEKYDSVADAINSMDVYDEEKLIKLIGDRSDWSERLIDRQFKNLDETEIENMNTLLSAIAWDEYDPKYKDIPNEEFVGELFSNAVREYYFALKAKECGVKGIDIPDVPEGLKYYKEHGELTQNVSSKDGGYIHTKAGDENRRLVKQKIEEGKLVQFSGTGIPDDVASGYKKAIMASVDSMDDRMAEIVAKSAEHAKVVWTPTQGRSNYSHETHAITLYAGNGGDSFRESDDVVTTFWHEFGHFADDPFYSKSGIEILRTPLKNDYDFASGASVISVNQKMYHDAARKDIQALLDMAGLGEMYGVTSKAFSQKVYLYKKPGGEIIDVHDPSFGEELYHIGEEITKPFKTFIGYDEYLSFMKDHGEPEEPKFTDYFESYTTPKTHKFKTRPKFKGAEEKWQEDMVAHAKAREKWIDSIGQEEYDRLRDEESRLYREYERKQQMMGSVTDCIDEAVNGIFALGAIWGGHDIDYYSNRPTPVETAANIFSIRCTNNKEVVAFMEKFIPNISRLMTQSWRCGDE